MSVETLVPGLLSSSTVHGHMAKKRRTGRDQCLECNPGFYRDGVICKPFSCETGSANGCISAAKPACGTVAQSLTGARQTKARRVARKQREQGTTNAPFLNWSLGTRNLFILGPLAEIIFRVFRGWDDKCTCDCTIDNCTTVLASFCWPSTFAADLSIQHR